MRAHISFIVSVLLAVFTASGVAQGTLPAPWTAADVGAPSIAGTTTFDGTAFAVAAGGKDVWSSTDQFQFVFQQITGDAEIIARVDSLAGSSAWAKAGVMFRASLAPDSANAFALVSRSNGVRFQRRRQASGSSTSTAGPSVSAPRWVRLTRIGTRVSGYVAPDGGSWTLIASDTIALGATAYVGLAVTSHDPNSLAHASFSGVSALSLALPSPQKDVDIGAPAIAGNVQYRQGSYTIKGAGSDIWGTSDQFHFVYQPVSGDLDVVARVASIAQTSSWAKAGVMVRESLSADARHASAFASAAQGYAFQRRIDPAGISTSTPGGPGAPPGWVRLIRTGYQFQAFWSMDGVSWTPMGSDTVPMTDPVLVGIAVTSHNTSQATTAIVDSLSIGANGGPTNQPPAVSLTAPSNGATFTAPATIALAAAASDPENRMARVDFYQGTTFLGSAATAPYTLTWSGVPAGSYSLNAIAYDQDGGVTTSAGVAVSVTAYSGPKTVSFTASTDNSIVTYYLLEVFASGADPTTAMPIASSNLGKPTPDVNNNISVDQTAFFMALAPGTYIATVTAMDACCGGQSAPITFVR